MKKTMAVVTIVFLGIAGMTGCASSERLLIQKNWEMKLPDGGTEDYHADTGASFHGDGEKYTVFQYRSTEDVSTFLDWKKDEDTATRYEDSYAEFAESVWIPLMFQVRSDRIIRSVCTGIVKEKQIFQSCSWHMMMERSSCM